MNALDKLNEITKAKRSQARKDRIEFIRYVDPKRSAKLRYCGNWIQLREWIEHAETKVIGARLCSQKLLCEVCAVRRQAGMAANARPKIDTLLEACPDLQAFMITLTMKTNEDLLERYNRHAEAWRKMQKDIVRARNDPRRKMPEMGKVLGLIRSIEIKRGKGDETHWNVHSHGLGFMRETIDEFKLSEEWFNYTGDSMIVDVRPVHAKAGDEDADPIGSAICEVLKYPLKFAGLLPADAWEAHCKLAGRRMTDSSGWLRGISAGDIRKDPGAEEMTGAYRDFIASWVEDSESFNLQLVGDSDLIPY